MLFFSLSERFYGLECKQYNFFICQYSLTPNAWNYTLVPQSKTWKEALEYCRDKFHSLATLEDQSKRNAAVVQRDFPVWIGLYREGKAPVHPPAGCKQLQLDTFEPGQGKVKFLKKNPSLGNGRITGVGLICRRKVEMEQRVFPLQELGVQ